MQAFVACSAVIITTSCSIKDKRLVELNPLLTEGNNKLSNVDPEEIFSDSSKIPYWKIAKQLVKDKSLLSSDDQYEISKVKLKTKGIRNSSVEISELNQQTYKNYIDFKLLSDPLNFWQNYSLVSYFNPLANIDSTTELKIDLALKKDGQIIYKFDYLIVSGFKKPTVKTNNLKKHLSEKEQYLSKLKKKSEKDKEINKKRKIHLETAPLWVLYDNMELLYKLLGVNPRISQIDKDSFILVLDKKLDSQDAKMVAIASVQNHSLTHSSAKFRDEIDNFWIDKGMFNKDGSWNFNFEMPYHHNSSLGAPLIDLDGKLVISTWGSVDNYLQRKKFSDLLLNFGIQALKSSSLIFSNPISFSHDSSPNFEIKLKWGQSAPKTKEEIKKFNIEVDAEVKLSYFYSSSNFDLIDYYEDVSYISVDREFVFIPRYVKRKFKINGKETIYYGLPMSSWFPILRLKI